MKQARALLANTAAIAADDPHLRRPAASLAADQLVKEWTLTREQVVDRRNAEAEATTYYEVCRANAIAETQRQMPLHRRLVVSADRMAAEYDDRHHVVCTDCGIERHDREDEPWSYERDRCQACGGHLVRSAEQPELPPPLVDSLAVIEERLAAAEAGRR